MNLNLNLFEFRFKFKIGIYMIQLIDWLIDCLIDRLADWLIACLRWMSSRVRSSSSRLIDWLIVREREFRLLSRERGVCIETWLDSIARYFERRPCLRILLWFSYLHNRDKNSNGQGSVPGERQLFSGCWKDGEVFFFLFCGSIDFRE